MTKEVLAEFKRRLNAAGYQPELDQNGTGHIYRRGQEAAFINDEGEILYKPWNRQHALYIRDMRDEVSEYVILYHYGSTPTKPAGFKTAPRKFYEIGGASLCARQLDDDYGYEFVTWQENGGSRETGHYTTDYAAVKRDFAVRAGLIERERLFNETELTVIRSNLSDFLSIDGGEHIDGDKEQAIKKVIDKIDSVVVPEIKEGEQEAEDAEFEPEHEL